MHSLYIIQISGQQIYNIVESVNISNYFKLLDKYSSLAIDDNYLHYNLKSDYKTTQNIINTDEDFNILTLIDIKFNNYKIKDGWYKLEPTQLDSIIEFISNFIEPISGGNITKTAEYVCQKCNNLFLDKRTLTKHLKECLTETEKFSCSTCGKQFVSQTCFQTHLEKCTQLICNSCHKTCSSKQSLENHIKNCGNFPCTKCTSTFTSKYKYKQHCLTKHNFSPLF